MKKIIFLLSFFIAFSCSIKNEMPSPNSLEIELSQNSTSTEQNEINDMLNSKPFKELMDFQEKYVAKKVRNFDKTKKGKNIDFQGI